MRVVLLLKYGPAVASSRVRWVDAVPELTAHLGADVHVVPLFPGRMRGRGTGRSHLRRFTASARTVLALAKRLLVVASTRHGDVVVVQKYSPAVERAVLRRATRRGVSVIFDLDDAEWLISPARARALQDLGRLSSVAIGGNRILCEWMRSGGAASVLEVPTPVDVKSDSVLASRDGRTVMWTGSPASAPDLELVVAPLDRVREAMEGLTFQVIGSGPLSFAPPWWEIIDWSPEVEEAALRRATVGLMPLADTPFNAGKCAYKALLYAGAGVRVVATPVGVNAELLRDGLGEAATTEEQWVQRVTEILRDAASPAEADRRRSAFGLVSSRYGRATHVHRLVDVLKGASGAGR